MTDADHQELLENVREILRDGDIHQLDFDKYDQVAAFFWDEPWYYLKHFRNRTADLIRADIKESGLSVEGYEFLPRFID